MTVVLLDPLRPTTIPMEAVGVVGDGVEFTDEVPDGVRTLLTEAPGAAVLVSTDPDHPTVREWVASGSRVIAAPKVPGDNLVEAAEVMDRLWSYGGWEVTQTHRTLSHYLVEETYEVLDAIESSEPGDLREELGDLLLQVLVPLTHRLGVGQFRRRRRGRDPGGQTRAPQSPPRGGRRRTDRHRGAGTGMGDPEGGGEGAEFLPRRRRDESARGVPRGEGDRPRAQGRPAAGTRARGDRVRAGS